MQDSRFARTVVYICAHSPDGAMGITINQPAPQITFRDLLVQLDIIPEGPEIRLPPPARRMRVHRGGPVETGRGFVLHSADYFVENSTLPIRRERLADGDAGDPEGDRRRQRTGERAAGARLCRLGAGPARKRDPGQRLAALPGRVRT